MPCSDNFRYDPVIEARAARINGIITRLACDRCRELEKREGKVPEWAKEWWDEHQEHDAQRLANSAKARKEAAIRKRAIAKLDPEEREELGV